MQKYPFRKRIMSYNFLDEVGVPKRLRYLFRWKKYFHHFPLKITKENAQKHEITHNLQFLILETKKCGNNKQLQRPLSYRYTKMLEICNVGCLFMTCELLLPSRIWTSSSEDPWIPYLKLTLWRLFSFNDFYIFKNLDVASLRSVRVIDKKSYSIRS